MTTRLKFDEVNALVDSIQLRQPTADELVDELLDYLIVAYLWGVNDTADSLGFPFDPGSVDADKMRETIYHRFDGETFEERVRRHYEDGDWEGVRRVAETETHRDYNEGAYNTAKENGATRKTWHTMQDDKVREAHDWLEGITVPIDGMFYIGDAEAEAPGMFGVPEYDVNCRCFLTYEG